MQFLPKFDNQAEETRLTGDATCLAEAKCLAVTKKHSGHLVMAPPFYSKNGCANRYSRMGELLLRTHFGAAFPGRGDEAFQAWWAHAEEHGLCYSFECVVPRILGDHGATPAAAYMVLTVVSHAGGGGTFLSPAQLLVLATAWRLPVNEVTFVPWSAAAPVEEALHAARWTLTDADASALLRECDAHGAMRQSFLSHGETQGEVLEGFVLMALDASIDELAPLLTAYEAAVAPARDAALTQALNLGLACKSRAAWLTAKLDAPSGAPEPRRIEGLPATTCWDLACAGDGRERFCALFRTLRELYAHRVVLKPYDYNGVLQLQVDIGDDQIFFGWPLHALVGGVAPLYRGMVVQLDGRAPPPIEAALTSAETRAALAAGEQPPAVSVCGVGSARGGVPGARVIAISKLKLLNYLVRTFGVRNQLPVLLDKGAPAYLAATDRFFKNWQIPTAHQERLSTLFGGWAREVQGLPAADRQLLRGGEYLWILEAFLRGERRPAPATYGIENFLVCLVNLTGAPLPADIISEYCPGMLQISMRDTMKGGDGAGQQSGGAHLGQLVRPGCALLLEVPPSGRLVGGGTGIPTLVILFPPDESAESKWHKMAAACRSLDQRYPHLAGMLHVRPPIDQWRATVANYAAKLPPPPPTYTTSIPKCGDSMPAEAAAPVSAEHGSRPAYGAAAPSSFLPTRTVIAILALPPGGGKSSLFRALQDEGASIVSSDDERMRGGHFDNTLSQTLRSAPLVCYDKNVPNVEGLNKLIKVLGGVERQQRVLIKVIPVVPLSIQHDIAWGRVESRPRTDHALNVHTCQGGRSGAYRVFKSIFLDPSAAFLPLASQLPSVIASDAFWQGMDAAKGLASSVLAQLPSAATLEVLQQAVDSLTRGDGLVSGSGAWMCAEIPRTKLHVTLVPPANAFGRATSHDEGNYERTAAIKRLQPYAGRRVSVVLLRYHLASSRAAAGGDGKGGRGGRGRGRGGVVTPERQVGFWEVGALSGLPEEAQYAVQRDVYHVTDTASLIGCAPREANDVLRALRRGDLGAEWETKVLPCAEEGEMGGREVPADVRLVS